MRIVRQCLSKAWLVLALAVLLTSSQLTAAMIRTDKVVSDLSSERARIEALVARKDVQRKIVELGVSPEEASQRVATLSDKEVRSVAAKMDTLPAGGDGIYIGIGGLVLLAILIILLVRR